MYIPKSWIWITFIAFSCSFTNVVLTAEENMAEEETYVIELDPQTFDAVTSSGNVFVKFFAPWCGHCKRLHPLWEQLAQLMNNDEPKVVIAKVDCTKHQSLCSKHEITGYPTLRLFKLGDKDSVKFQGTRDLPAITDFINQHLSTVEMQQTDENTTEEQQAALLQENAGKVIELNENTFAQHLSSGTHFVKFFAPWCSHCQRLAPVWEEVAKTLVDNKNVILSKIDCTQYRPICQDFDVKGFPTLLWIEDGKKIEKYTGGRDHDTFISYIEKMLGVSPNTDDDAKDELSEKEDTDLLAEKLSPVKLNGENFAKTIENGITFVKFYAPWCGHCQKLSPIWDQLAAEVHVGATNIVIAKVDCTQADNKQICIDQQIEGYPSLFAYKNGQRQNEYEGTRTLAELQHYVTNLIGHDEL